MRRFLFPLVVLSIVLSSCAPVRDRRTLNDVEALMPERPDSALAVLRGLQPRDLPGLHVRPLHALLLSEALDKNYIDLTDDSLALAANQYYGDHGTKLHRLKSWYYLGRIRFNAGNYAEAVICYNKALEYAESLTNYHYMGLINREIANSYNSVWDDLHATEYIQKSIDSFSAAGEKKYVDYSRLALARTLRRRGSLAECDSLLNTMLRDVDNDYISACIYELKGLNCLSKEESPIDSIQRYFRAARIGSVLAEDATILSNLAYVQELAGCQDSSDYYLGKARNNIRSRSDSTYVIYNQSRIAAVRDDYEGAYNLYRDYNSLQSPVVYQMLEQSISSYQRSYYQNESRINAMKAKIRAISYGSVVLLLFMLALYLLSRNRKQRALIVEEMNRTAEVQQELLSMRNDNYEMGRAVATLFENRLNILQTLSDQYDMIDEAYQQTEHGGKHRQSRVEIVDSFRDMMRTLRKDKDICFSMEEILDSWKDGIMRRFRTVFGENSPSGIHMSGEDFELAPFFFSGMKFKTINYLTGHTEHALRERKRRIKQKINALSDSFFEEKTLFLSNL